MIVTAIEDHGKTKKKVYLDGQFAFVLYNGELSGCHIMEQRELPEEVYERIMEEILWKRIRQRALFLLKDMDRTEYQLRQKLKGDLYPEKLIHRVVEWLYSYHYLDDERYAENYVRCHVEKKSRRQMVQDLLQKGVEKQIAEAAVDTQETPNEEVLIRKWIEKKKIDPENASTKDLQKLYGFLLRKGFSPSEVSRVLKGMEEF